MVLFFLLTKIESEQAFFSEHTQTSTALKCLPNAVIIKENRPMLVTCTTCFVPKRSLLIVENNAEKKLSNS